MWLSVDQSDVNKKIIWLAHEHDHRNNLLIKV